MDIVEKQNRYNKFVPTSLLICLVLSSFCLLKYQILLSFLLIVYSELLLLRCNHILILLIPRFLSILTYFNLGCDIFVLG